MCPPLMSALNRANKLGLTGFPFASYAALKAAVVAISTAAVNKPVIRQLAQSVDKELDKHNAVGIITADVYGAASIAAARTAVQALYVANGGSGALSANHAGPFLGG